MAIKITKESSENLSKIQKYLMTSSPAIISMKDVEDGTSIPVTAWLYFTEEKEGKDPVNLTAILSGNTAYALQSRTFTNYFEDIVAVMGDEPFSIIKRSGVTSGKDPKGFIYCELDVEALTTD